MWCVTTEIHLTCVLIQHHCKRITWMSVLLPNTNLKVKAGTKDLICMKVCSDTAQRELRVIQREAENSDICTNRERIFGAWGTSSAVHDSDDSYSRRWLLKKTHASILFIFAHVCQDKSGCLCKNTDCSSAQRNKISLSGASERTFRILVILYNIRGLY